MSDSDFYMDKTGPGLRQAIAAGLGKVGRDIGHQGIKVGHYIVYIAGGSKGGEIGDGISQLIGPDIRQSVDDRLDPIGVQAEGLFVRLGRVVGPFNIGGVERFGVQQQGP